MKKTKLYAANTEIVSKIVSELEIVKSRFDEFMKGMEIKGLSTKYFSNLSLGKQKFSIEIYEKLARNFNLLYKKKNLEKTVSTEDLYIDDERIKDDGKSKTIYLEKYNSHGRRGDFEEKVIFNQVRATKEIANLIEKFVHATEGTLKTQKKFANKFYSAEETLQEIRDEAEVNSIIDELEKKGVYVYGGLALYPIISYRADFISHDDSMWEIKSWPYINAYYILVFSSDKEVEYFKFKYEYLQEIDNLEKLNKKFPIKFNFLSGSFDPDFPRSHPENEEHHQILDLLAKEYSKHEFNDEFINIVGDISDLPFTFTLSSTIIPVKKNKLNDETENEI
jgi:hypothetical protein